MLGTLCRLGSTRCDKKPLKNKRSFAPGEDDGVRPAGVGFPLKNMHHAVCPCDFNYALYQTRPRPSSITHFVKNNTDFSDPTALLRLYRFSLYHFTTPGGQKIRSKKHQVKIYFLIIN